MHYSFIKNNNLIFKTAIFANALNYIQEIEDPIGFMDIFCDYEKEKDDLGIMEDV